MHHYNHLIAAPSSLSVGRGNKQTKKDAWPGCKSESSSTNPPHRLQRGDLIFPLSPNDCCDSQVGAVVSLFSHICMKKFCNIFIYLFIYLQKCEAAAAVFLPLRAPYPHTCRHILISLGRLSPRVLLAGRDAAPSQVRIVFPCNEEALTRTPLRGR